MINKDKNFVSFQEFRQLEFFKSLNVYLRKTIIVIGKEFPETEFLIDEKNIKNVYFKNIFINNFIEFENYNSKTTQNEKISNLLNKISIFNNCISAYKNDNLCKIERFTFQKSKRNPEFVYHQTNTPPEVILKSGIKKRYSLSPSKPFNPLVFIGTEACWYGKYTYKIKTNKQLYIDTNMDWRRLDKRPYLCLKDDIEPNEIVEFFVNENC